MTHAHLDSYRAAGIVLTRKRRFHSSQAASTQLLMAWEVRKWGRTDADKRQAESLASIPPSLSQVSADGLTCAPEWHWCRGLEGTIATRTPRQLAELSNTARRKQLWAALCLPLGKRDDNDEGPWDTAAREFDEETGSHLLHRGSRHRLAAWLKERCRPPPSSSSPSLIAHSQVESDRGESKVPSRCSPESATKGATLTSTDQVRVLYHHGSKLILYFIDINCCPYFEGMVSSDSEGGSDAERVSSELPPLPIPLGKGVTTLAPIPLRIPLGEGVTMLAPIPEAAGHAEVLATVWVLSDSFKRRPGKSSPRPKVTTSRHSTSWRTQAAPHSVASADPGTSASAGPGTSASAGPGTSASADSGTSASADPGTSASATRAGRTLWT